MKRARTMVRQARAATLAALAVIALPSPSRAQQPPPSTLHATDFSPYEQETIADALRQLKLEREDAPEGKLVEGHDIVTLEVFENRDPLPGFVNVFHWTTRPYVVEREMLVVAGERYNQVLVDESVRNLRKLAALSVVLAVPVKGSTRDRVRILVITKDVWSLRLNSNIVISSGGIESLLFQPNELNAFGSHHSASLLFDLEPATVTLGGGYRIPRIGSTRMVMNASANGILNRTTGKAEGSYGQLLVAQPLFSARTPWAWDSLASWDQEFIRRFVNAREATFALKSAPTKGVPWEYQVRSYLSQQSITRSFGWATKNDFSLGSAVDLKTYRLPELAAGAAIPDPATLDAFQRAILPRSDSRIGPFVQYHGYTTKYLRVLDFETLGLQEDYRLGHEVYARVYPILSALGSSRDVLGVYAAGQYTVPLGDGMARGSIESTTEAESDELSDASLSASLHIVTPRLGFGRLVYDAHVLTRYRNYLNRLTYLGGNGRLRGYPTNFLIGKDVVNSNLEFRTRAFEILACEVGAAAFYDVGDAFDGFGSLDPKHGVGAGLRILFPQVDRIVLRSDFGFPLGAGARLPGVSPMSFFFSFSQAFPVPTLSAAALPSGP